jgi:oxalate decarboxylase/phosphoglucose isomerase-like protein (cupin superfamily)
MRIIKKSDKVLAKIISFEDMKPGLNFFSENEEFIQVGAWKYEKGKELLAHIHNKVDRAINRTHEVLYVIKGELEATIYTLDEQFVEKLVLQAGSMLILLECGHGYKILEDDTTVLEIKNGPYLGAEIDRRRI